MRPGLNLSKNKRVQLYKSKQCMHSQPGFNIRISKIIVFLAFLLTSCCLWDFKSFSKKFVIMMNNGWWCQPGGQGQILVQGGGGGSWAGVQSPAGGETYHSVVKPKSQIKAPIPYSRYPPPHLTFSPDQSIYSPQRELSVPKACPVFQVKTIHDILLFTTSYIIYDLGLLDLPIKPVSSPGLKCLLTPLSHWNPRLDPIDSKSSLMITLTHSPDSQPLDPLVVAVSVLQDGLTPHPPQLPPQPGVNIQPKMWKSFYKK